MEYNTVVYQQSDLQAINACAETLMSGYPIIFPTETVYGLACSTKQESFKEAIYALKGRELNKPLALMVSAIEELSQFDISYNQALKVVLERFWPGALTIVFPLEKGESIGVRIPNHPFVLKLLKKVGPLYVTSANISRMADATDFQMAFNYFNGCVKVMIDGGECSMGQASTVILATETLKVLREGVLTEKVIATYKSALGN